MCAGRAQGCASALNNQAPRLPAEGAPQPRAQRQRVPAGQRPTAQRRRHGSARRAADGRAAGWLPGRWVHGPATGRAAAGCVWHGAAGCAGAAGVRRAAAGAPDVRDGPSSWRGDAAAAILMGGATAAHSAWRRLPLCAACRRRRTCCPDGSHLQTTADRRYLRVQQSWQQEGSGSYRCFVEPWPAAAGDQASHSMDAGPLRHGSRGPRGPICRWGFPVMSVGHFITVTVWKLHSFGRSRCTYTCACVHRAWELAASEHQPPGVATAPSCTNQFVGTFQVSGLPYVGVPRRCIQSRAENRPALYLV
jgi:hypothetical protein